MKRQCVSCGKEFEARYATVCISCVANREPIPRKVRPIAPLPKAQPPISANDGADPIYTRVRELISRQRAEAVQLPTYILKGADAAQHFRVGFYFGQLAAREEIDKKERLLRLKAEAVTP